MARPSYPGFDSQAGASAGRGSLYAWVDARLGLEELLSLAKAKRVPLHRHSFWYYWGGLSLFFFLVQMVSGILLLLYYQPGPDAYDSVRRITYDIDFGWLVRSAHSWAANLMVACVFVHMFSVFFMRAYRPPREFGWWSGLALLGLTMVFGFSGYLLPMDELAYFATQIGLKTPETIPILGPWLSDLARGGAEVTSVTIQRFFALHAVILPALFVPLLGFHLWLVQRHGNASPPSEEAKQERERRSIPFFPTFLQKDLALWLIALNVLAILASLFPWQLGAPADSLAPAPVGIHPEWYFMAQFQLLKVLGGLLPGKPGEVAGLVLFGLGGLAWALIPLFDPSSRFGRRARAASWFGFLALAGLIFLTVWGYWVL